MLPNQMSYEELEQQWGGMLHRFTWDIDGMDRNDVLQELRIVLMLAQKQYDPTRGCAFSTYLWRSCLNKVGKLRHQVRNVKKRVPARMVVSLCEGDHGGTDDSSCCSTCLELPRCIDNVEILELLTGAAKEVRVLAGLILRGERTRRSWKQRGLTSEQIKRGVNGLKSLLKGGRYGKSR